MKARLEGEDWVGLEDAIKEFNRLTPREEYVKKLAEIKERAAKDQIVDKVAILTKNAQAQINDLQALIDRYLDDEAIKAYREAHDKGLSEMGEKEKAKLKAAADAARAAKAAAAALRRGRKGREGRPQNEGGTGRPAQAGGD